MVIAIDGPAGCGKSTIAALLAERFGQSQGKPFVYINSGKLYRAITLGCLRSGINVADTERCLDYAKRARIEYRGDAVLLDGENVTALLHTDEIDRNSAPLSAFAPIRHVVNEIVRATAAGCNAVVEGRDMTTVVFPDARHRFYLDASAETRARRRHKQGVSTLSVEEIRDAIVQRDEIDKNKSEGSLVCAPGVYYLDTSDLTVDQVYEKLTEQIEKSQMEGKSMVQKEV
ncbi:MAG: (d)CMP kinase, partial [Treponema sp.]|nr:(d)CMP kinase [Treponema sp.]